MDVNRETIIRVKRILGKYASKQNSDAKQMLKILNNRLAAARGRAKF